MGKVAGSNLLRPFSLLLMLKTNKTKIVAKQRWNWLKKELQVKENCLGCVLKRGEPDRQVAFPTVLWTAFGG